MSIVDNNTNLRETHTIGASTREWLVSSTLCPALLFHEINLVGITEAAPLFRYVRPDPQWGQILACTGGWGWVWLADRWVRCEAGEVYLTPPHVLHGYHADPQSRWSLCWVQSSGDWLKAGDCPLLFSGQSTSLAEAISGLLREVMQSGESALLPPWSLLVASYARRLVHPGGDGDSRLRPLWDSVNDNLAAPWHVGLLAEKVQLSPEHLRRLCHSSLGVSPMRHVTALRMRRAAALLASESYTIEAIALLVGYDNPYAFSTAFKRLMGVPPSKYR